MEVLGIVQAPLGPASTNFLCLRSDLLHHAGFGLAAGAARPYFIYIQLDFFLRWGKALQITVETYVRAPVETVWAAYTTPEDIKQWNAASDDWHTTQSFVDLRVGGAFTSRMEAKDGSFGFDFAGTYTKVVPHTCIGYAFGDRNGVVEFTADAEGVTVRVTFDAESQHPVEQQRQGWQAILNNFAKHVEATNP